MVTVLTYSVAKPCSDTTGCRTNVVPPREILATPGDVGALRDILSD
jgi:hypothetical protein